MSPRYKNIFVLALAVLGLGLVFGVQDTHAVPSSLTVAISGSPTISIPPTAEGKFVDSGNSTITVTTTHAAGYVLSARAGGAYNPTSLDTNGGATSGGTVGFTTIGSATNYDTFSTDSNYNGKWGYKPSKYNSADNNDYLPSPSTSGDTLAVTNDNQGRTYSVSIGARANINTAMGSYSNTFIFAVVGNATPYAVTYNKNTTDTVTNMPTNHTTSDTGAEGETVTLDGTVPVRDGYNFKGWCSVTTTDATCSGTTYNPDGGGAALTLTINQTSSTNSYTLYAMWEQATQTIQSLDLAACSVNVGKNGNPANVGDELTVKDSRDQKQYTVRYINGACWMTQNLAIEPGTQMTADDTNITSSQYLSGKTYYELPGSGYDLKTNGASGGNCYGSGSSGAGYTNACTHVANATDVSEAGSTACGGSACTTEQLGAWYNYAAATATSIKGTSTSTVDTYNICPKGWTMPANGTSTGQIGSIGSTYKDAFKPLYGGRYYQGSHSLATTYGYWWSTTAYDATHRYYLYYNSGSLDTSNLGRFRGFYVRCVRTT